MGEQFPRFGRETIKREDSLLDDLAHIKINEDINQALVQTVKVAPDEKP